MSLIIFLKFWWRNIEASSPNKHLLLTVLFNSFHLVQPLQCAVVSFVQFPWLDDWNIVTIKFIGCVVECLNSTSKDRGVANIEIETVLLEDLACLDCFLDSCYYESYYRWLIIWHQSILWICFTCSRCFHHDAKRRLGVSIMIEEWSTAAENPNLLSAEISILLVF